MPSIGIGLNINNVVNPTAAAPPAISFIGVSAGYSPATTSATWPIDNVDAAVLGDLLVLVMIHDQTLSTGTSGWTEVAGSPQQPPSSTNKLRCYWRYATASEPATYTFTFTPATAGGAVILQYRDAHPTVPVDVLAFNSGGFNASAIGSSISPVGSSDQLILAAGSGGTRTYTGPGGAMTERYDTPTSSFFVATETLTASGATGTRTATISSGANWATMMLALKGA